MMLFRLVAGHAPPSVDGEKENSYHIYALREKNTEEKQRDRMITDEIS